MCFFYKVNDYGFTYVEPDSLGTTVSLCPQAPDSLGTIVSSAHREARTCKEAVHWSSRLKLRSKECSKKRWSMEERKLQSQPEKKLGQPKNNIFYILNQLLSRKCRRQGCLLPQFLELQQLEVSPTHRMSSPKWVIEVCQSNPISILDFKNTKI